MSGSNNGRMEAIRRGIPTAPNMLEGRSKSYVRAYNKLREAFFHFTDEEFNSFVYQMDLSANEMNEHAKITLKRS